MEPGKKLLDRFGRRPEERPSLTLDDTVDEGGWRIKEPLTLPAAPQSEGLQASPAVGDTLGGYCILGPLGAGGMGQVFRARDSDLEREVALKVLHPGLNCQPHAMSRLHREARLLAAVHHPNIATLFGTFEDGGVRFLVMELVDGKTLAEMVASGRMAVPEALDISRQIAAALEAAHRKEVIHRDLKPANVMVSPEGWVKVLDFGLAKVLSGEGKSTAVSEETRAQGVLGTAPYMSPEQLRGLETDWRTDVWAFGCVLFELVTGLRAFAGKNDLDLMHAILFVEPPWRELPAELPASVVDLLHRCLAQDTTMRPPMSDIRTVLEHALVDLRTSGSAEVAPFTRGIDPATSRRLDSLGQDAMVARTATGEAVRPAPRRSWATLWAMLLVLAVGGFATWRWSSGRSSSLAAVDSVVVMPSRLLGAGQPPYLQDAIAQTLAGDLVQMKGVTTKQPPSSFDVERLGGDLSRVAAAYDAETMVLSTAGLEAGNLTLNLELVDAGSRNLLWSRRLQGAPGSHLELARRAAAELRRALRSDTPAVPTGRFDPQEERLVRQGVYYANLYRNRGQMDDRNQALAAFEKVLVDNPTRADLAGEIAMLYAFGLDFGVSIFEIQPEIRRWTERALALDPRSSKAWAALAFLEETGKKEGYRRQLEYLLKAVSYDPTDSYAANRLSGPLVRFSAHLALVADQHASEIDPLMLISQIFVAIDLSRLGRHDEALTQLDQTLALEPGMPFGLLMKGFVLCKVGRPHDAVALVKELEPLVGQGKVHPAWVATVRDQAVLTLASEQGDAPTAEAAAKRLLAAARGETPFPRWEKFTNYVAPNLLRWGHKEEGLELLLFRSRQGIDPPYDYLLLSPDIAPLREDPRFRDDPRLEEVYARARASFEEILAILEEARAKGELPEYLEQPIADLLKRIREARQADG